MQHHFDEHSRKRLMELLDEKSLTHNTMRSDEVQGFMMALLSGPDVLTPEDWLPEVLGEEALFEAKERTEVERLVLALAVDMRRQMSDKRLPDLWLYEDNAGNPDFYTWCNAYLYALEVVPTNWFETVNQEEFEDLFYPIMALGGIYDDVDVGGQSQLDSRRIGSGAPLLGDERLELSTSHGEVAHGLVIRGDVTDLVDREEAVDLIGRHLSVIVPGALVPEIGFEVVGPDYSHIVRGGRRPFHGIDVGEPVPVGFGHQVGRRGLGAGVGSGSHAIRSTQVVSTELRHRLSGPQIHHLVVSLI